MKNIVVPTDFSPNARIALDYAIQIANELGSTIHLVNGTDTMASTSIYSDINKMMQETAKSKLDELIKDTRKMLDPLALILPKTIRGHVSDAICDYAEKVHADMIIMGTQGASSLKDVFIGTVALGVIKRAKLPVMIVPGFSRIQAPQKIALAIDEQEISGVEVIEPVKQLAKAFNARIELFHFNKQYAMTDIDPHIESYMEGVEHTFHDFFSSDKDINKVINEFVKSEKIDMLALIRRKRSFLENLFHKSVTRKEVFNSPVPLVVLRD